MSFFSGFMRQTEEALNMQKLERKLQSARLVGADHCLKCGFCCHRRSCIPSPDEIPMIALFLKMSVDELLAKHYAVDRLGWRQPYHVKPVGENTKEFAGSFIPSHRTFDEGKCIFLRKSRNGLFRCEIYPVRPASARAAECWNEQDKRPTVDDTMKEWEGEKLKKIFGIDGQKLEDESDPEPVSFDDW